MGLSAPHGHRGSSARGRRVRRPVASRQSAQRAQRRLSGQLEVDKRQLQLSAQKSCRQAPSEGQPALPRGERP
eukprot:1671402-Prymnesium_polylepis.1